MSLPPSADDLPPQVKAGCEVIDNARPIDSRVSSPGLGTNFKNNTTAYENGYSNNGFLAAPLIGPIRPVSPDTLSNLSADEYEQIYRDRSRSRSRELRSTLDHHAPGNWRAKLQAFYIHNLGLGYMLLAQLFGTGMNITTRLLEIEGNNGKGMHPFQILFVRMGITVALSSAYMWWTRTPHFPLGKKEVRWLLVVRGFSGFFGVTGMYWSLLYLPLGDATVITFLAPGLACWACSYLLNEPFGRIEKIAGLISLVGIVLIAKPAGMLSTSGNVPAASGDPDMLPSTNNTAASHGDASNYDNVTPSERLFAVSIALLGVLGSASAYTTIRWIGQRAHPLISVNYFACWCTFVSFIMMLALPWVGFVLPANLKEWGYLIFLGTCGFIMQFLLSAALSYEKSSRVTNMTYTQMFFAMGGDSLFFGHSPDGWSIAGSSLILGSAVVVAAMAESGKKTVSKDQEADVEAQQGLISGMEAEREGVTGNTEDHGRLPVQEIQLRTLR